ncbi:Ras-related protein Rab-1B [Thelohanellus kitauei]|uniref:Ras-related protein Rab-1B n=1 Tax=Thelohanellus kitauei TaxID=669202 RepID=A0A0C2I723_THEKT|nr:Ras-related protein Rab-1B [Thelohanellus kitauei]
MSNYDYLLKMIMIGDSSVGKTCILKRECDDSFQEEFIATIGIDFKIRFFQIDDMVLKLQIWDTAGQERFKSITTSYYRMAMGIFIVFDLSRRESFEHLDFWMNLIDENADPESVKMLVGNKSDLNETREVTNAEGQAFAKRYGLEYVEISAKTGQNVNELFLMMSENLLDLMRRKSVYSQDRPELKASIPPQPQKRPNCC